MKTLTVTELRKMSEVECEILDKSTGKIVVKKIDFNTLCRRCEEAISRYFKVGKYSVLSEFFNEIEWTLGVGSACTDGIRIFFNPVFANELVSIGGAGAMELANAAKLRGEKIDMNSFEKEVFKPFFFVVLHEIYHQVYRHIEQEQRKEETKNGKNHDLSNYSMDAEINRDIEIQWPEFKGITELSGGVMRAKDFPVEFWQQIFDSLMESGDYPPMQSPMTPNGGESSDNSGDDEGEGGQGQSSQNNQSQQQQGNQGGQRQPRPDGQQQNGQQSGGEQQSGQQQNGQQQNGSGQQSGDEQGSENNQNGSGSSQNGQDGQEQNQQGGQSGQGGSNGQEGEEQQNGQGSSGSGSNGQDGEDSQNNQNGQNGAGGQNGEDGEDDAQKQNGQNGNNDGQDGQNGQGQNGPQRADNRNIAGNQGDVKIKVTINSTWDGSDIISKEEAMALAEKNGNPYNSKEKSKSAEEMAKERLAHSEDGIKGIGKGTARDMGRILDAIDSILNKSVVDWKSMLARHMKNAGGVDVEDRFSRKRLGGSRLDKYELVHRKEIEVNRAADIFYLVDASGSIGKRELYRVFSEVMDIEQRKTMTIRKSAFTYFADCIDIARIRVWDKDTTKSKKMKLITYVPGEDVGGDTEIAGSIIQVTKSGKKYFSKENPQTMMIVFTDGEDQIESLKAFFALPPSIRKRVVFCIMNRGEERLKEISEMFIQVGVLKSNIVCIDMTTLKD